MDLHPVYKQDKDPQEDQDVPCDNGNGKPGALENITRAQSHIRSLQKQVDSNKAQKKDRRALFFSVAALSTAVASIVIGVIKMFI